MNRTDWDDYYRQPFAAARFTRRITQARLLDLLRRHGGATRPGGPVVVELGGANSCFFDAVQGALCPSAYHVVDSNQLGLDRMRERLGPRPDVTYHRADVLDLRLPFEADVVFSVGLVEHFDPEGTRRAVAAHFEALRPGGLCVLSAPTPTFLYRATRGASEALGLWKFPDERPLTRAELTAAVAPHGRLLAASVVWPIFLTQLFVAATRA